MYLSHKSTISLIGEAREIKSGEAAILHKKCIILKKVGIITVVIRKPAQVEKREEIGLFKGAYNF